MSDDLDAIRARLEDRLTVSVTTKAIAAGFVANGNTLDDLRVFAEVAQCERNGWLYSCSASDRESLERLQGQGFVTFCRGTGETYLTDAGRALLEESRLTPQAD